MTKKKKKSAAADALIESLMDDLKDIQGDSSIHLLDDEHNAPETPDGILSVPMTDENAQHVLGEKQDEVWEVFKVSKDGEGRNNINSQSDEISANSFINLKVPEIDPIFTRVAKDDHTVSLSEDVIGNPIQGHVADSEKTLPVEGFANVKLGPRKNPTLEAKASVGLSRGSFGASNVMTSIDASLAQAESLKIAQQRILDLEKEVELLRAENEELASAGEIVREKTEELSAKIVAIEKEKSEMHESFRGEIVILKGNLQYREVEFGKARTKIEELEARLKSDFKKIRVRERELENRLELLRAEKNALVRSKDEYILDQKRKMDQLSQELDNYRKKCLELNKTIEENQEQVKRTERALRLALTNLESKGENLVPIKKAE